MPRMNESRTRFRFTQTKLKEFPPNPPESRSAMLELSDSEVIGLRLLISKRGRKSWLFRYNFNTRKSAIKIADFEAFTLKEARERAWEYRAMIARGLDPVDERRKRRALPTFGEFIEEDYMPFAKATKRCWYTDVSRLETGALTAFRNRRMDSITIRDVTQFHCACRERTSASTANRHLGLLRRIFNLAVRWGVVQRNPCDGVTKMPEAPPCERYLTVEETGKLLRALEAEWNPVMSSSIRMLLFTGLRLHEVLDLRWDDVNFEQKSFRLRITKSGRGRVVYPSSVAWAEIEKMFEVRPSNHPFVFPGRNRDEATTRPTRAFHEALARAGISRIRIHDLRHTFASHMVQSGATLFEVQRVLGHTTPLMTQRYAHLTEGGLRDRAEEAALRILQQMEPSKAPATPAQHGVQTPNTYPAYFG